MLCLGDDNHASIVGDKLLFYAQDTIDLTWSEDFFENSQLFNAITDPVKIQIKLHIFYLSNDVVILERVADLTNTDRDNTAPTDVTLPNMISHSSDQVVYAAKISIEAVNMFYNGASGTVTQWTDIIWIVPVDKPSSISSDRLWSACQQWEAVESSSIGQQLLQRVRDFPCPPRINQATAINSGLIEDGNTKLINFFHPGGLRCFHQRTTRQVNLCN